MQKFVFTRALILFSSEKTLEVYYKIYSSSKLEMKWKISFMIHRKS